MLFTIHVHKPNILILNYLLKKVILFSNIITKTQTVLVMAFKFKVDA